MSGRPSNFGFELVEFGFSYVFGVSSRDHITWMMINQFILDYSAPFFAVIVIVVVVTVAIGLRI